MQKTSIVIARQRHIDIANQSISKFPFPEDQEFNDDMLEELDLRLYAVAHRTGGAYLIPPGCINFDAVSEVFDPFDDGLSFVIASSADGAQEVFQEYVHGDNWRAASLEWYGERLGVLLGYDADTGRFW